MASIESSFPFSDQANAEDDWRALIGALSESGVLDGLEVTAGSGMQVLVAPGEGFVEGFLYQLTGDPKELTVTAAHGTYQRLDSVVLRADLTTKAVTLAVLAGDATAGGGELPDLADTSTLREVAIRTLTIPSGATNVTGGMIGPALSLAPTRVKVYGSEATRPNPTDQDYALGVNVATKAVEFWNGSAWSNIAVPWAALTGAPATFAPAAHTLDSHTGTLALAKGGTGATDAAGALAAIGAAAAAHTHPATGISDSTATGRALLTAASASAARTTLGAGAIGAAVFQAADWVAAREALGIYKGNGPTPVAGMIRLRDI